MTRSSSTTKMRALVMKQNQDPGWRALGRYRPAQHNIGGLTCDFGDGSQLVAGWYHTSRRPKDPHQAHVAQRIEHCPPEAGVAGSSPAVGASQTPTSAAMPALTSSCVEPALSPSGSKRAAVVSAMVS